MKQFIVWVTHWWRGTSDGYDLIMRARDIGAARRKAKAYARQQAQESGHRVTVKVESLVDYNRRLDRESYF